MDIFWHRWLQAWCWVTLAFGIMFTVCVIPALSGPTKLWVDIVFWPLNGQPTLTAPDAILGTSLVGAVLLGWGLLMLGLVRDPVLSAEPRVWWLMTMALLVWYVVDNTASVLAGAAVNVVSNTMFVATWLIPIVASGILGRTSPAAARS